MKHSRHRQPLKVVSELNITNLLDTAFILLITFMLVAPQLDHGITVDLPKVKEAPALTPEPERTMVVHIRRPDAADGRTEEWIYLDGEQVTLEQLEERVRAARAARPELAIVVQGDLGAGWGVGVEVLGAIKRAGVSNIGIGAEPRAARP